MKPTARGPSFEGCLERRPGLAKTTRVNLFQSRTLRLVASSDARWGELFDAADVMSEGASRGEGSERSYFGSSNIILLIAPEDPDHTLQSLAGAVARDPHVRLRAMRVARREAAQRANAPLDRVRAEITVSPCTTGVAVHVEVEAAVLPDRRTKSREPASVAASPSAPPPGAAQRAIGSGMDAPAGAHASAALVLPKGALPVESPTLPHRPHGGYSPKWPIEIGCREDLTE